jgi:hypothetical protein
MLKAAVESRRRNERAKTGVNARIFSQLTGM